MYQRIDKNKAFITTSILMASCLINCAYAQSSLSALDQYSYERLVQQSRSFPVLADSDFGESVNLQDGSISFEHTDIQLNTNSGLKVELSRVSSRTEQWTDRNFATLGYGWELNVPYIMGTFDTRVGWADSYQNGKRCSDGLRGPIAQVGPWPDYYTQIVPVHMYFTGFHVNLPGYGREKALFPNAGSIMPSDGVQYKGVTKSNWRVSCLSTVLNAPGEGYIVTLPNGTKYFFNWLAKRNAKDLMENPWSGTDENGNAIIPGSEWDLLAPLTDIYLFATKIEDIHGNTITYNYDPANPQRLLSIVSNDGAQISLQYNQNGLIASATANQQTWTYQYQPNTLNVGAPTLNGYLLSSVTEPDGRNWGYSGFFGARTYGMPLGFYSNACSTDAGNMDPSSPTTASLLQYVAVTNPSGAKADFTLRPLVHGTNNTPGECTAFGGLENLSFGVVGISSAYSVQSLIKKSIQGPGVALKQWDYSYSSSWTFAGYCINHACQNSSTTSVATNDGVKRIYKFGNDYKKNMGQILSEKVTFNNVTLSEKSNQYIASASGQPFADTIGDHYLNATYTEPSSYGNAQAWESYRPYFYGNPFETKNRPNSVSTLVRNGVTYTGTVNAFDAFARPIDVTRSNSNGYSKTELTQYVDNTSKWVLGQVGSVADVATGLIEQSNTYDPVNANLLSKSAFGVLQESYTYNADGTIATVKDGKNNTYTLANWKRGIPQLITAPNSTTQSGVVNDSGWLTSVTNQRGYTTGYAYDPMGRLSSITPPTGDTVVWAGTTLTFTPLTAAIYGVPAGGWKHSISRGNYRKETYMDALYRPLVIREYDNGNVAGTERFTVKAYDTLNREVFSSYPGKTAGLTVGVRTEYDALGRVTATKADSELGVLTTTTEYLAGGGIKVTGPDGNITTRSFRSLDAPSYEQMVQEVAPGGVTTSISRDVFGKPLTITRSGTDGLSISKQFAYDANQRLCMRTEPETGTSIIDYDAAGNVLWAANGQAVANPAVCNRAAAVAGAKINYSYDALNRVTGTDVPGSTNDPTVTYYPDGSVNTLANGTATWTYTYNKLGKPVTESLALTGNGTKTITHAYDTLANEASLTYPNGTAVSYAPNALGQATQAGTYATGMNYRASGFMSSMTYGNGATYSAQPNLRGLPARRLDSKGTSVINDELMAYDQDANPVCVRDSSAGNPGSRDFSYDARDRLIKVSAPNQGWISAEYQYDSQDNIQMARLGTRQYNYSYTTLNRLADIGQPASAPVATNFGLLSCSDQALLADIDSSTPGTGGGTGGSGGSGGTLVLSPATLDDGMVDEPYSQTLSTTGGTAPYTYALSSGNLPLGLSLSGNTLSGTPSVEVSKTFTITSTDSTGQSGSQSYTVTINPNGGGTPECPPLIPDCNIQPQSVALAESTTMVMAMAAGDTLKYAFTHDAEGRMTAKGTQAYVYDALNRMTQVTGKESYLYDGHGRRVQVTKTSDSKKNYPLYGLDGKLLVEDNRQTLKRTEYIYANGRLIAKRIQPITAAGANNGTATVTTIHTDFLGSPVAETNSAGTVTRVERYTPYGEPADMQLDVGPGFTGHATDVATGLTYMQQRYYDADIGRFLIPDPVGPEEDFIKHFNRYNYALNNPVRYTDPDGREVRDSTGRTKQEACGPVPCGENNMGGKLLYMPAVMLPDSVIATELGTTINSKLNNEQKADLIESFSVLTAGGSMVCAFVCKPYAKTLAETSQKSALAALALHPTDERIKSAMFTGYVKIFKAIGESSRIGGEIIKNVASIMENGETILDAAELTTEKIKSENNLDRQKPKP